MKRTVALAVLGALTGVLLSPPGAAQAHEERSVGKWHFAVGFGDEPAYTGFKNSVELLLRNADDKPVNDLGDTLKVEVSSGTEKMTLSFEPNFEVGEFGTEGDYRAWFVPTRPGDYSFHVTGKIKGDKIDQTFTSSEKTFDSVKDVSEVEFPVKDPSSGEVAARVEREKTRTDAVLAAVAKKAKDDASSAKTLGLIGVVVGALGLLVALALGLRRKV